MCGTKPDCRTSDERPNTSPNSSSISRRIRSKLAKRSFSEGGTVDRLDVEDSSFAGNVNGAAKTGLRLAPSPQLVHLVRDVRDQHRLDPSGLRMLAGLAGCEVAAHPRPLGARQRSLDHEQVGAARE